MQLLRTHIRVIDLSSFSIWIGVIHTINENDGLEWYIEPIDDVIPWFIDWIMVIEWMSCYWTDPICHSNGVIN